MIFIYIIFTIFSFLSIEAIYISPCAKWNTTGVTIIGTNSPGNSSNELSLPQGIFLHKGSNTLYIADTGNRRIQMISLNQSSTIGVTVASNIDSLSSIYVDDDGISIYVSLRYENRVEKWIKGQSQSEQIGDQCKQCAGVWVDQNKNVYMSESGTHSILKWSTVTNTSQTIAGKTDEEGQTTDHLYFPRGIFINHLNNALYIADTMNNRVQKWTNNSQEGITVAGSKDGIPGYNASGLSNPLYVWVDETSEVIYIADSDNNRVQRWKPNELVGSTIAGGIGPGSESSQLTAPNSLAFDNHGNLYVCDGKNHRVQMFLLTDNQTCPNPSPSSSSNSTPLNHSYSLFEKTTTTILMFLSLILWYNSR